MSHSYNANGIRDDHQAAIDRMAGERLAVRGVSVCECPGCREAVEVPDAAPVCPHCGYRITLANGYAS